jgi:hypothetical protein
MESKMKKLFVVCAVVLALSLVIAPAAMAEPKVGAPHLAHKTVDIGQPLKFWGSITPRYSYLGNKSVYAYVYKKSQGDWVQVLNFQVSLAKYLHALHYKGWCAMGKKGTYKVRAKLYWDRSGNVPWEGTEVIAGPFSMFKVADTK